MLGCVVLVAAWRIDRLENLGINPWSVPGLLPGIVGVLMILLALALGWQTRHAQPPAETGNATAAEPASPAWRTWGRTLGALALCVLFAAGALGRGLPFMPEAAIFIFLFTSAFSWSQWRDEGRLVRGLATAMAVAVAAALFISWLFESVFLVRLP